MLNKIIYFSLNNKLFILLGAILLLLSGIWTAGKMDIDVFPDLTAPTVVVMSDAGGMATEEVERLITFPIETAVNGAAGVRRVRSTSMQGYSFVWVEFDWGTDIFKARQIVGEKMVTLSQTMPQGVQPVLAPQSSIMGEIFFIGLQSDSISGMDLRTLAEWQIKPAILATGGVSQVTIIGGDYKQYQVLADPQRMKYYQVSLNELEETCSGISENSSGGVFREYGNEYTLRGIARTHNLEELGNSIVKMNGNQPVYLNDVAEVKIDAALRMGTASKNARPAIILSVSKQPGVNTLTVTKNVEKNLLQLQETLPSDVKMDTAIFRQADFIETSVNNVTRALIEGAIFVLIILFLFLGSFRTTVISIAAIPLSLLGTIIVLHLLGMNINTMSLGGMCIAIGSLVDDAIIDVENVYKRLRQNHLKPKSEKESIFNVVFNASREIRASILNATFIIIVAFIPLFFLSGMEGRMLKPLGITFIISLFMSLVVAMTLTPLLCKMMLSDNKYLNKKEKDSWLVRHLNRYYERSLRWTLHHRKPVLISTISLFAVSFLLFLTMGSSFLPEFNEGALTITAVCKPGISLEETDRLGTRLEEELLTVPEVKTTARRTGRGELDEHSQATNSTEIDVKYDLDKRSNEEFLSEVRRKLSVVPGVSLTIGQPIGHRIDHILSGTRANIAVKLFGPDLHRLFSLGNQVQQAISDIPGLVDVSVEQQTEVPEIQVRANRMMLARHGITMEDFNRFVSLAFSGEKQAEIFEGQRNFDLVLKLKPDYTTTIEGIKSALIDTGAGGKIPLEEVADIVSTTGPNAISRENVQRKIVVSVNVAGRDVGSAAEEIRKTIASRVALPEGYRLEYGGQFESAQKASRTLLLASLLAIGVIFLLLYQEFKNIRLAALILVNLPLALIGGILAVFFTSAVISIPSIIGFITLFGIATRNGILLVSNYQHLKEKGVPMSQRIIQGSTDRLNAILMTAITAGLALLPMIFNGDKPGNEIQSPMAIVILGGLLTSTLLNIYIIPILYHTQAPPPASPHKRRPWAWLGLGLFFLFCIPSLKAQPSVLEQIEQNNTLLSALRQQAEAEKTGNKTGIYPGNPEVEFHYLWGNRPETGDRVDFSATQNFDFPTAYYYRKKVSDAQNQQIDLKYRMERKNVLLEAQQVYIRLIYQQALSREWGERLNHAGQIVQVYQTRFDKGDASALDLNKAKFNLLNVQKEYHSALAEKEFLFAELSRLNGGKRPDDSFDEFPPALLPGNFEQWYDAQKEKNFSLQYLEQATSLSRENEKLQRSLNLPKFSAGYMSEKVLTEQFQGITVGVSIPLWENKNTVKRIKAQTQANRETEADARLRYYNESEALYKKALHLQKIANDYKQNQQADNMAGLLKKALDAGEISLIEYIMESGVYYELVSNRLEIERDLHLTLAGLMQWEL
jgi:CzcA family heavy metal efflux pump